MKQAEAELEQARWNVKGQHYALACFLCQQAAEKAAKAVYQAARVEVWGHAIVGLLSGVPGVEAVPDEIADAAKALDRHYIPARYPNGFASGVPADYYTAADAEEAIRCAEEIIAFCERGVP